MKKILQTAGAVVFWLLIWQLAAFVIHNKILLAGPIETINAFTGLIGNPDFITSVLTSVGHILLGIVLGAFLGIAGGVLCLKFEIARILISPLISIMKSIPVASFVIMVLIWIGNEGVSTVIVTLVVIPILFFATTKGVSSANEKLLEMAHVYRMPAWNRVRYIYFPALIPSYLSAFSVAVGMGFKSGVAAEVIGQPLMSIGNGLYRAKINLDTGELFAWTLTTIVLSWLAEKLFLGIIGLIRKAFLPSGVSSDSDAKEEGNNDN